MFNASLFFRVVVLFSIMRVLSINDMALLAPEWFPCWSLPMPARGGRGSRFHVGHDQPAIDGAPLSRPITPAMSTKVRRLFVTILQ